MDKTAKASSYRSDWTELLLRLLDTPDLLKPLNEIVWKNSQKWLLKTVSKPMVYMLSFFIIETPQTVHFAG